MTDEEIHRLFEDSLKLALAIEQATAKRCAEICEQRPNGAMIAVAIRKEYGLTTGDHTDD